MLGCRVERRNFRPGPLGLGSATPTTSRQQVLRKKLLEDVLHVASRSSIHPSGASLPTCMPLMKWSNPPRIRCLDLVSNHPFNSPSRIFCFGGELDTSSLLCSSSLPNLQSRLKLATIMGTVHAPNPPLQKQRTDKGTYRQNMSHHAWARERECRAFELAFLFHREFDFIQAVGLRKQELMMLEGALYKLPALPGKLVIK